MSTLAEIETAADSLPSEQKEELLRFLAMRLRKQRTLPKPRIYSEEELASMLAEDQLAPGKASEWLRTAKGSIRAAAGESADDARMAHTDGLEWLRASRADIQREIGATPQARAAYYQEREKSLGSRIYRPAAPRLRDEEPACVLREEPPK